jgi:hypothetical protein
MFDRFRWLLQRIADIHKVEAMTDRDLDDLDLTRAQLHDFLRMPKDISQRATAMGAVFGLPEAELRRDHDTSVDLLSTCGPCAERGEWARVLALGDLAHPDQADFCDNRFAFADLAAAAD